MPASELVWRFEGWQRRCKERADALETAQFLEATINSIPCLIWYKTADGIHEKVNDSFCETVGKEKGDVQGRGHAYIWDVETDESGLYQVGGPGHGHAQDLRFRGGRPKRQRNEASHDLQVARCTTSTAVSWAPLALRST